MGITGFFLERFPLCVNCQNNGSGCLRVWRRNEIIRNFVTFWRNAKIPVPLLGKLKPGDIAREIEDKFPEEFVLFYTKNCEKGIANK